MYFPKKVLPSKFISTSEKYLLQINRIWLVITLDKTKMLCDTYSLSYTHLSGKVTCNLYSVLFIAKERLVMGPLWN